MHSKYLIKFIGRTAGAIGVFYPMEIVASLSDPTNHYLAFRAIHSAGFEPMPTKLEITKV